MSVLGAGVWGEGESVLDSEVSLPGVEVWGVRTSVAETGLGGVRVDAALRDIVDGGVPDFVAVVGVAEATDVIAGGVAAFVAVAGVAVIRVVVVGVAAIGVVVVGVASDDSVRGVVDVTSCCCLKGVAEVAKLLRRSSTRIAE